MKFTRHAIMAILLLVAVVALRTSARGQSATSPVLQIPQGTSPQELDLPELTDDPKPQDLFAMVVAAAAKEDPAGVQESTQNFALYGPFRFPNDTTYDIVEHRDRSNSIFGIDISHWTVPSFPVEQLAARNVAFLYMKATQAGGVDGSFARFWQRSGNLSGSKRIHRGAYHFLTCGDPKVPGEEWGRLQANTFIKVVEANGGLLATDMPPAADLEWDVTKREHDRWVCREPDEIIATVQAFLREVKNRLRRTPILYTSRAWWRERLGSESGFAALSTYPIWVADYSQTSRASEIPPGINDTKWVLWQFTDSATMAIGFNAGFDASIFKGSPDSFLSTLGVGAFQ
jgi:lysozyme